MRAFAPVPPGSSTTRRRSVVTVCAVRVLTTRRTGVGAFSKVGTPSGVSVRRTRNGRMSVPPFAMAANAVTIWSGVTDTP